MSPGTARHAPSHGQTSTPVGQPLTRIRPALRSRTGSSRRAISVSSGLHLQRRRQLALQLFDDRDQRRRRPGSARPARTSRTSPPRASVREEAWRRRSANSAAWPWLTPWPARPRATVATGLCRPARSTPALVGLVDAGRQHGGGAWLSAAPGGGGRESGPDRDPRARRPGLDWCRTARRPSSARRRTRARSPRARAASAAGNRNTGLMLLISA